MSWVACALVVLLSTVLLFVPGGVLSGLLGARGLTLLATAPAVSVGVVVLASVLLGALRLPFSVGSVAVVAVLCWLAAVPLRRLAGPVDRIRSPRRASVAAGLGIAAGAVCLTGLLVAAFGGPADISQRFDVVFHLNAVRFVLDTGDASPLVLGTLNGGTGANAFYPSAWHALTALAVQATGAPIPVAVSGVNIAVAAIVWPAGCVGLTRALVGPKPLVLLLAGVFSAGLGQFPLLLLDWGVVYANFLGVALLPAALALLVLALGAGDRTASSKRRALVLLAPAVLGAMGAHPSDLAALAVLALPAAMLVQWRWFRARRAAGTAVGLGVLPHLGVLSGTAVVLIGLDVLLKPPNGFPGWDPTMGPGRAALGVLAGSLTSGTPPLLIGGLILVGVVVAVVERRAWIAGAYLLALVLFWVGATVRLGPVREIVIGAWYQDVYRVAALAPVLQVPLAAIGGAFLLQRLLRLIGRRAASRAAAGHPALRRIGSARIAPLAALVLVAVVASVGVQGPHLARAVQKANRGYRFDGSAPLLTPNETGLFARLPRLVPRSAVIADNPWDGSGLAYALTDRRVLATHLLDTPTPDQVLVQQGLRTAQHDPAVCAAVHRTHVGFALDLGPYVQDNPATGDYRGLEDLEHSDAVTLVASDGNARLYRVLPCSG